MSSVNGLLNVARKYLGVVGGSTVHKRIVDEYNRHTPLAVGYKVKYTDDWCDVFVTKVAIECGMVKEIGTECGVERHIQIFKDKGIWFEDGRLTPKSGDIICYNWNDGTQPNTGWADHIGFVEQVKGGIITTIEGNYSNVVKRRSIVVGSGVIRGYARPNYGNEVVNKPVVKPTVKPVEKGFNLPKGVYRYRKNERLRYGEDVKDIQKALISLHYYPDVKKKDKGLDGWYGEKTANAIKRVQSMYGLKQDGDYGSQTMMLLDRLVNK